VDDDPRVAASISRRLRAHGVVLSAGTVADALAHLATVASFAGACIALPLPDGAGLEIVERSRELCPMAPVMVLTGFLEAESINHVHALGAKYVAKPPTEENFVQFFEEVEASRAVSVRTVEEIVRSAAEHWQLTPRESEALALAVQGYSRAETAERLGVTPETVKTHTKAILAKTGCLSLREVVQRLFLPRGQ